MNKKEVITIATSEIGYSRWTDPLPGTKYGRDYATRHGSYFGASGVPYCAMFVTWVFRQAGTVPPGGDFAYCPTGINTMKRLNIEIPKTEAQPGDIVFFDWGHDGESDHVGFVTGKTGSGILTVEGNTTANGVAGCVAARKRPWRVICNVFRPPYTALLAAPPLAAAPLAVDGWFGPASITRLQRLLGSTPDGIISSQPAANRPFAPRAGEGWEWVYHAPAGSQAVKLWQARIGASRDGWFGPETVRKTQAFLGVTVDGYAGHATMSAWQTWLNNQQ